METIGALWNKKDKKGDDIMSGVLDINGGIAIMCFKNKFADGKKPDWKIVKANKHEKNIVYDKFQERIK